MKLAFSPNKLLYLESLYKIYINYIIYIKPSKYPRFAILNVPFKLMPTTAQSKLFSPLDTSAKDLLIVVHHLRNGLLPSHLPSMITVIIYVCSLNTTQI